jgi:hypothetical protein
LKRISGFHAAPGGKPPMDAMFIPVDGVVYGICSGGVGAGGYGKGNTPGSALGTRIVGAPVVTRREATIGLNFACQQGGNINLQRRSNPSQLGQVCITAIFDGRNLKISQPACHGKVFYAVTGRFTIGFDPGCYGSAGNCAEAKIVEIIDCNGHGSLLLFMIGRLRLSFPVL